MHRLLPLALLFGCAGSADDLVAQDSGAEVELACDDQIDDDADGLTDCDDSDCADVAPCTWPTSLNMDATLFFDANSLAKLGGYDDCTTHFTSTLQMQSDNDCAECDRIYLGNFTYVSDDCPQDPNNPRPTSGEYGMVFGSETSWTAFFVNQGTWTQMGAANDDGSAYVFTSTDTVDYQGTEVGSLTTTFRFSEP
ncbi:MAG: hypothetical protein EP330_19775 [Deltaproteobacteria bacterium]|nr:MAG: hypothetical protein EP330_19775 [Deltaproteobacteria bacterium]